MGIEPTLSAWKAEVLPLNYTRVNSIYLGLYPSNRTAQKAHPSFRPTYINSTGHSRAGGGGRIRTSEGGAVRFTV